MSGQPGDSHELIRVHGARVNNVEDVSRIVLAGTPADLVAGRCALTGEHLAAYVSRVGQDVRR